MRSLRFCSALFPLFAFIGCGGPNNPNVDGSGKPIPAPQSTESWKSVENAEYASWKKFPIGTVVKRTCVTTIGENSTTSVETYTLKEIGESEIVVERQNTTTRSDGSFNKANEAERRKLPKVLAVHPELKAESFSKPDPNAKDCGEETLAVLGKEYKCRKYEWKNSTEAGPMAVSVWTSEELPGRIAKQEMIVSKIHSKTVDEVTEIRMP